MSCCVILSDVGGEDDEDARGEALVQKLSRQQSGQAAVALQQLLMQPPAQGASNLLLCQKQSRQQLGKLWRNRRNECRIRDAGEGNKKPKRYQTKGAGRYFTTLLSSTRFSPLERTTSKVSSR